MRICLKPRDRESLPGGTSEKGEPGRPTGEIFQILPELLLAHLTSTRTRAQPSPMKSLRLVFTVAAFAATGLSLALSSAGATARPPDSAPTGDFFFPSTGVSVDNQAVLLAIDDYLLPLRENVG